MMEKITWTDHFRNAEVLQRVKEDRNILQAIIRRKANWIGHMLRRNCLLKHTVEGREDEEEKHKKLLNDFKENRILETEIKSIRLNPVENSLCKKLWTCRKREYDYIHAMNVVGVHLL